MKEHVCTMVLAGWILALGASMSVPANAQAPNKSVLLFDFEQDTEEWRVDWDSLDAGPQVSESQAHHGKKSIAYAHRFKPDQQTVGGVVTFKAPRDFSEFEELSGWVYIPEHDDWQAQMYVRSGDDWTLNWGRLYEGLKRGWNRVEIKIASIGKPTEVKDVGIQIKNWNVEADVTLCIDQVEAIERK